MSVKRKFLSVFTALVVTLTAIIGFTACSSQVSVAMEVDGEMISAGLYILYSGRAAQEAQSKVMEENPDLKTDAEDFSYNDQKVGDVPYPEYVKNRAVELCKRHIAVNKLFDKLNLSLDDKEKKEITDGVNNEWDYEVPSFVTSSMPYLKNYKTLGAYYESCGVAKSSYKDYVNCTYKASKIFTYYYGKDGIEEVPKEEKEKWLSDNYALTRYFAISMKDKDGKLIESKTELELRRKQAIEFADRLSKGENYVDVYDDYVEYSKALTSTTPASTTPAETTAAEKMAERAAEPEVTTAAVEETQPVEVTTAAADETAPEEVTADAAATTETEPEATTAAEQTTEPTEATTAAETTAAETTTAGGTQTGETTTAEERHDHDYNRVINKDATSPSEKFVKALFEMPVNTATVIEEDTAYYVVQKLDILKVEQDDKDEHDATNYLEEYDGTILQGLRGDQMDEAFKKEYDPYTVEQNKQAPDYCKQQSENAANCLAALSRIQYLMYYYGSMFGG